MGVLVREPFQAEFNLRDGISIRRVEEGTPKDHRVMFNSSESDSLAKMMISVLRVEEFPLIPKFIKCSPFECQMDPDRTFELRRKDQKPGTGVRLGFDNADDIIWLAENSARGYAAEHARSPIVHHSYRPGPDPLI